MRDGTYWVHSVGLCFGRQRSKHTLAAYRWLSQLSTIRSAWSSAFLKRQELLSRWMFAFVRTPFVSVSQFLRWADEVVVAQIVSIPNISSHRTTQHNMHSPSPYTHVQLSSCKGSGQHHTSPYVHPNIHSHGHILVNTHPNTPINPHTQAVYPELLALLFANPPPSFQGKSWSFTTIQVFACTNCRVVQVYPGADVWKHTLSLGVST